MREIKFRGKRIDNSEWIYGDYYKKIIYKDSGKGQIIHYIGWQIKDKDGTRWNEYEAVDIETVGEYTGLKDKNGKEIYEGNIIRYLEYSNPIEALAKGEGQYNFAPIGWDETGGAFRCMDYYLNEFDYTEEVEVIGNIYEHSNLLDNN